MSESEETEWRLGIKHEEAEEKTAELSSEEVEKKEELQETTQTKAKELGGGEEGSVVTKPKEEPIIEAPKKKERKVRGPSVKSRESDTSKSLE